MLKKIAKWMQPEWVHRVRPVNGYNFSGCSASLYLSLMQQEIVPLCRRMWDNTYLPTV